MAQAVARSFKFFRVLLGSADSPIVYAAPCGFNSRSLQRTKNLNEVDIPDCADEDAPAWVGREVRSLDFSVNGEGLLVAENIQIWEDAFNSDTSLPIRVELEYPAPVGTIVYEGKAHIASYEVTGNRGEKISCNIQMSGDGALVLIP